MTRRVVATLLAAVGVALPGCDDAGEPDTPPGRWTRAEARGGAALDAEQRQMIEQLEAIGYASGSRPPSGAPTLRGDDRVAPGLNFYTSGHGTEAILMDMKGATLHRWHKRFEEIWPEASVAMDDWHATESWRRARLLPNGDVLVIFEGLGLAKLDLSSELIWSRLRGAHHDLEVAPDGRIYVLERDARVDGRVHEREPVLEDFVAVLAADGRELSRVSLLDAFENSRYRESWRAWTAESGDIFHTNSLRLLDGSAAGRNPAFAAGNVLISMRELDAVAVVDLEVPRVVWALRGDFRQQHDPSVIGDGNLLLFDNQGGGEASSVIELDLADGSESWRYEGSESAPFYSETCGTASRLPGGHTLIVESDAGRAFEVTPEGEIVWEFNSPHRAGAENEFVATLFDLVRLPPDFTRSWRAPYAIAGSAPSDSER